MTKKREDPEAALSIAFPLFTSKEIPLRPGDQYIRGVVPDALPEDVFADEIQRQGVSS